MRQKQTSHVTRGELQQKKYPGKKSIPWLQAAVQTHIEKHGSQLSVCVANNWLYSKKNQEQFFPKLTECRKHGLATHRSPLTPALQTVRAAVGGTKKQQETIQNINQNHGY